MPRLVEHMEHGLVARWLRADGDEVTAGDEIVEIETDKATTTLETDYSGVLHRAVAAGEEVPVGALLATIRDGAAPGAAAQTNGDTAPSAVPADGPRFRHVASPVARRMAREHCIPIDAVQPSDRDGRVRRADVLLHIEAAAEPAPADAPHAAAQITQELTSTQRVGARRMADSKATVPDFAVSMEVDMAACLELRAQIKEHAGEMGDVPSVNDMVVKACALALRRSPQVNGAYRDGAFELHDRVNVGVAAAGEGLLVVPTVRDADRLSLGELARETRRLAAAVRDGSVTASDLAGATFTVSNLGMFGVSFFVPIVNPPQAAILAVGAVADRVVARDGEMVIHPAVTLTLVSDHRVVYGVDAARFLVLVRDTLERPLRLAVG